MKKGENKMIAYHNKPELKKSYLDRLKQHRDLEHLTQGVAFKKNGETHGCNIVCLFNYYDHAKGAKESGIPEVLLRLADTLFEGLPPKNANDFAYEWPAAIKTGADLSRVKWQFCAFLLKENIERVLPLKIEDKLKEKVINSIRTILKLHEDAAINGTWDESSARTAARSAELAESAARSAEWSAEWSAAKLAESAKSAARVAAWSARSAELSAAESAESAESAAWSAESAAWSAAWAESRAAAWSARSAAKSAAYKRYAKEFIRLLGEKQ